MHVSEEFRCRLLDILASDNDAEFALILLLFELDSIKCQERDAYGLSICDAAMLLGAKKCSTLLKCPDCSDEVDREKLKCPICQETLMSPLLSWCGHAFCRPCVLRLKMAGGMSCACPVCRGALAFPDGYCVDSLLKSAAERLSDTDTHSDEDRHLDAQLEFFAHITRRLPFRPQFSAVSKEILVRVDAAWLQFTLLPVRVPHSDYRLFISVQMPVICDVPSLMVSKFAPLFRHSASIVVMCAYQASDCAEMLECFCHFLRSISACK